MVEIKEIDVFEDPRHRINSEEYQGLIALYDSVVMEMPNRGDVVNAIYGGLYGDYHIFSVSTFKDDIYVENKPSEVRYLDSISIGESVDVVVSRVNHNDFFISGSLSDLYESKVHEGLEDNMVVTAYIRSINPAGYDVDVHRSGIVLPAFMPNTLAGINKLHDPSSIVGQTFEVFIESYAEKEGTYIVNRKKYLQTLIPEEASKLSYGVLYTGHVTGTTPFGVFVEFNNCLTSMIHKVNLLEELQNNITDIKPGTEIQFYVKELFKERGRHKIILTQVIRETLWDTISIDQVIDGTVKDVKTFGALISLDDETVGLIHNNELERSKKNYTVGSKIRVKINSFDRMTRKILLGLV